jgi:hypothetical protein
MVINKNAYKFDLLCTIRKRNNFHISFLDRNTPPTARQPPSEVEQTVVDNSAEWQLDQSFNSMRRYRKFCYRIQWLSNSYVPTSWEPLENLVNVQ